MNDPALPPTRDLEEALAAAGGNAQLAEELFAMLRRDLEARLEEIRARAAQGDLSGLRDAAHRLHGATHYCGVPALRQAVHTLEEAATQGPVEDAMQQLEAAVRAVMDWEADDRGEREAQAR